MMDDPTQEQPISNDIIKSGRRRKRERSPARVSGEALAPPASADERQQAVRFARAVHGPVSGGIVYATVAKHLQECSVFAETSQQFTADFIERVAPRDPLEELLAIQMLWTHARAGYLATQATQQRDPKKVKVFHEAADEASNTYRKMMLGLAHYRRPPRGGDTFMAIRQTNVAEQQVVQNQPGAITQGARDVSGQNLIEHTRTSPQAPLPDVRSGTGFAAEGGVPEPAVVEEHRPAQRGREGPGENERVSARRAVRRSRRSA